MNTSTAYKRLSWAFKAQNFRALELDALVQPRSISLDSVPPDLVEALNGMLRESTNWSRIGEQIALLRERLNESGNYLWDVYLGASSQKLRVIVVCGFGGTLSDQNFKTKFDYTWVIMQSLESHIRQFQISPELIALLDAVRQQYLTSTNPVIKAIVDLARSFVASARASGGPIAAFLGVATGGLTSDLSGKLRGHRYEPTQSGPGAQPCLEGAVWDCRRDQFNEDDLYFGRLEAFDDALFKQSM